ncbi:MAG: DUF418 domain-containing protein [Propioniciclava sp.]
MENPPAPHRRILSPDVARGLMLLGIAIANLTATAGWVLFGSGPVGLVWAPDGPVDAVVGVLNAMVVYQRGLPMFTTLLGYGIGMLLVRGSSRGATFAETRALIRRRYLWLAVIGLLHGVFVFFGDILLIYGVLGFFVALLMLRATDRTLLRIAAILYGLMVVVLVLVFAVEMFGRTSMPEVIERLNVVMAGGTPGEAGLAQFGYLAQVVAGLLMAVSTIFGGFIGYFFLLGPVLLVGFVAARRSMLEHAESHRTLLRRVGFGGIAISLSGGLVVGLMNMGLLGGLPWLLTPTVLSMVTGLPGGVAAVALIALWCLAPQQRIDAGAVSAGVPFDQLRALGRRSLSGYLFQSVVFLATLPAFTLGLIDHLTIATGTAYAAGVWAVSVGLAWLLDRRGDPGPAERLHRRLTYGRAASRPAPVPPVPPRPQGAS